ncbi:MAG: DUF433 domain-containing protein [Pseudomonadota bacterium]
MKKTVNKLDPRLVPNYGFAEAARYLDLPYCTVRSWAKGMGEFKAVIELPDASVPQLSFVNLVEMYVLGAIRRTHRISMPRARKAIEYAEHELKIKHPLAELDFRTDKKDLFINFLDRLVDVSGKQGQVEIREVVELYLLRIERKGRFAVRLFPFARSGLDPAEIKDQPRNIVIDPKIAFGRPVILGTGIQTRAIAERFKAGETMRELASDFSCKIDLVEEAIRYEQPAAA